MQPLFLDTRPLDQRVREKFNLTEDIMMENAAVAIEKDVQLCADDSDEITNVLVLAGSGNNGADGYALSRRLAGSEIKVTVCEVAVPKSEMCKTQKLRAEKVGVEIKKFSELDLSSYNIIVDCIFGSGFHGILPEDVAEVISKVNETDVVRIACDVPTGLDKYGNAEGEVFSATVTVTMGANKVCLYSDAAKEFVGEVVLADLGVSRNLFCGQLKKNGDEKNLQGVESNEQNLVLPEEMLLEESDMVLPHRNKQNVNKGSFGHAAIVTGEKIGAGVIAGSSTLRFGAGLVTLVSFEKEISCGDKVELNEDGLLPQQKQIFPYELMCSKTFPSNTTAVALGMGLGRNNNSTEKYFDYLYEHKDLPCVLDADIFYSDSLCAFLKSRSDDYLKSSASNNKVCDAKIVLTPHPKEFVSLLEKCSLSLDDRESSISVNEAVENKVELVKEFCLKFPGVVLLLKGANVTIGVKFANEENVRLYVNPYGTSVLAKAGSGDVLSGMICSLLAQKYNSLDATISASLAHALASRNVDCDFSLTPFSLMKEVSLL